MIKEERFELNDNDCIIDKEKNIAICDVCDVSESPEILVDLLNQQDQKIADLEAKLAELREQITILDEENSKTFMKSVNAWRENAELKQQLAESEADKKALICDYESRITKEQELMSWLEHNNEQLKQQLAEKDQAIEGLQDINKSLGQTCNNDAKEIERLREQLADIQQEQIKEMQEHKEAMEFADKTITNLVEDNRVSQEWYKQQLAEKEHTITNLIQDSKASKELLKQKLAEKDFNPALCSPLPTTTSK